MSTIITKANVFKSLALIAVCAVLFSFSSRPAGGEGFEIYLNNRLVLEKFGNNMNTVNTLNLEKANDDDVLSVRYHHCGRVGKSRTITIKDAQDKVLKEWKFDDVTDVASRISCKVKDILGLRKGKDNTLKLYYSSSELPKGRLLASIAAQKGVAKL
jgi:hypothetical protein